MVKRNLKFNLTLLVLLKAIRDMYNGDYYNKASNNPFLTNVAACDPLWVVHSPELV